MEGSKKEVWNTMGSLALALEHQTGETMGKREPEVGGLSVIEPTEYTRARALTNHRRRISDWSFSPTFREFYF